MGEYIYRRTSRVSNIKLPNGEFVQAVHLVYAYKPYLSWSGDEHNKRFRRTALLAVANADRSLERRGFDPSGFKFAVTEYEGKIEGGTILRWATNVPRLVSDYWDQHVVGTNLWPCPECHGKIRKQEEHPGCLAEQRRKQEENARAWEEEQDRLRKAWRAAQAERVSATYTI